MLIEVGYEKSSGWEIGNLRKNKVVGLDVIREMEWLWLPLFFLMVL
jgi:hypothetical protein